MIHVNEVEKDSEELMSFHAPGSISIVSYMKEWRREVETLFLFRASSSSSVLYDCYERGGERSWRLSFFL